MINGSIRSDQFLVNGNIDPVAGSRAIYLVAPMPKPNDYVSDLAYQTHLENGVNRGGGNSVIIENNVYQMSINTYLSGETNGMAPWYIKTAEAVLLDDLKFIFNIQ